jgi:ATP phosphoribosyltransferase
MELRIKLAVQKSGRLRDGSLRLLEECGIHIDNGNDQLKARASNFPLDVLFLRNSDIPRYVEDGVADAGILGENLLYEQDPALTKVLKLGFSKCRLSIAVPKNLEYNGLEDLNGKKVATSYPNSLRKFLQDKEVEVDIHEISGSVEIAPNIGLADAICDLVSSGSTLFRNGLLEKDVINHSEACLVKSDRMFAELEDLFNNLLFRIQSVLKARDHKYILMNVPTENIDRIIRILPGMKSPTVMPLAVEGWSSVHTVIREEKFWEIIDRLKKSGAQGILVTSIEKMIL